MKQEGKTEFGGCIQVLITMCNNSLIQSIKNWYKFKYICVKNLNSLDASRQQSKVTFGCLSRGAKRST